MSNMTITNTAAASTTFAAIITVTFNKVSFMNKKGWKNGQCWVSFMRRKKAGAGSNYDYMTVTENARGDLFARMDAVVC